MALLKPKVALMWFPFEFGLSRVEERLKCICEGAFEVEEYYSIY